MATVRVHELAKELNLSSKDTIALLGKVGIRASTHMSAIDENRARIVNAVLGGERAAAERSQTRPPRRNEWRRAMGLPRKWKPFRRRPRRRRPSRRRPLPPPPRRLRR